MLKASQPTYNKVLYGGMFVFYCELLELAFFSQLSSFFSQPSC